MSSMARALPGNRKKRSDLLRRGKYGRLLTTDVPYAKARKAYVSKAKVEPQIDVELVAKLKGIEAEAEQGATFEVTGLSRAKLLSTLF